MARELGPTLVLRSGAAQALGVAMNVLAVLGLWIGAEQGLSALLRSVAGLALFGLLGWAVFWRPRVQVSEAGVLVENTWRSVDVPWSALDAVEGRYGLRLLTSQGPVTAWAVPAPSGRSRRNEIGGSEGAVLVAQRLESHREAASPADRDPQPTVTAELHLRTVVAAGLLLVAAVVLALLG